MKRKHLFLAIAALLAAGGLWLAWTAWRSQRGEISSLDAGTQTSRGVNSDPNKAASLSRVSHTGSNDLPTPGQVLNPSTRLRPPDPARRFMDFTPEERVQQARRGHGPGG